MPATDPGGATGIGGERGVPGKAFSPLDVELAARLESLTQQQLRRALREIASPPGTVCAMGGRTLLNFGSNDYLGLASHPRLKQAADDAAGQYGAGSAASRLISGSLSPHHRLEEALAEFKQAERALMFSSGYAAALGTIPALLGRDDFVVIDKLSHACLVDAARLSGATLRVFRHNDLDHLEKILRQCRTAEPGGAKTCRHILVVTESVFSMDGDFAPLARLVELKERHGAWLMVDEAHATGLFGAQRSGRIEQESVRGRVEVQMGTLGKALGAAGGFITGSATLIDYLVNRARSFVFSTAPSPAVAAAALAGMEVVRSEEGEMRLERLRENVRAFRALAGQEESEASPIVPVPVGDEAAAMALAERLFAQGIYAPAIRYPTVGRGRARLRLTFSAEHTPKQVRQLAESLSEQQVKVK